MIPARAAITESLLSYLANELQVAVGDGQAPPAAGWSGGQPGAGNYVPYVVLITGSATPRAASGQRDTLGPDKSMWTLSYSLRAFGVVRAQADYHADAARAAWDQLRGNNLIAAEGWTAVASLIDSMGQINRNDSVDPPLWELTDSYSLWVARARV